MTDPLTISSPLTDPPTTAPTTVPCRSSHVTFPLERSCAAQGLPYIPPSQCPPLVATVTDAPDEDDTLLDLSSYDDNDDNDSTPSIHPSHDAYMTSPNLPPNPHYPEDPSTYAEVMVSPHAANLVTSTT